MRVLLKCFYTILCLCGLLYQLYLICAEHFAYKVNSSIKLSQTTHYEIPSLSICFPVHEIFDYDMFNSKYNLNATLNNSSPSESYLSSLLLQSLITVDDALQFTPPIDGLISNCEIRNSSNFMYHYYERDSCHRWIDVEKYFFMFSICYKTSLRNNIDVSVHKSSSPAVYSMGSTFLVPTDQGDILYIYLNETNFDHFNIIENVMHPTDAYPAIEIAVRQALTRSYTPLKAPDTNMFNVQSSYVRTTKLPPPYVTNCQDYQTRTDGEQYYDSYDCSFECTTENITKLFKKASLAYHYKSGVNLKLLTIDDFSDLDFNNKYKRILYECQNLCPPNECKSLVTYTTSKGFAYSTPTVFASFPEKPSFDIDHNEKVKILDTINFICSTLGVWFGFSFYGIHPFNKKEDCHSNRVSSSTGNNEKRRRPKYVLSSDWKREKIQLHARIRFLEKLHQKK